MTRIAIQAIGRHPALRWICLAALIACAALMMAADAGPTGSVAPASAPESYGAWVLAPAVIAILCAMVSRQVVPSLLLGVVVAAFMMQRLDGGGTALDAFTSTAQRTVETYVLGALVDEGHVKIIVFTLLIGAMVGVVAASGGTRALVDLIARRASTSRRGQLVAWAAGLVVFFDDYANSMIVGPTMQPICDRLKISRAKLAYIVDSTAAPVASIALVGTWVGAELQYIDEGLRDVAANGTPAFLSGVDAWQAFVCSIPYRFYAILAIVTVLLAALLRRDIGPMRRSEAAAQTGGVSDEAGEDVPGRGQWLLAALPILTLVGVTGVVLLWPGLSARRAALAVGESFPLSRLLENADSYNAILYGALACLMAAVVLSVGSRRTSLRGAMDAVMEGMARVFPAVVVLVLAWSLSQGGRDLHVGEVVSGWLRAQGYALNWLPLGVFVSAAFVSFATGTSWGTMGILCPMVVRVAADLGADVPPDVALPLFFGSVGSVLAGAIFGDHCSPISDTTVLSSIASGCSLEEHVWTQMPYAVLTAVVAMAAGDTLCSKFGHSPWLGLAGGALLLLLVLRLFGRRPAS